METIVALQLLNPMEVIIVTQFFTWLLSGFARRRVHKCASTMLKLDDYMLRDIGLTQNDVLHCMSSPTHMADHCLPARRSQNLETAVTAPNAQAAPSSDELAA